jgi:hypothetical protein
MMRQLREGDFDVATTFKAAIPIAMALLAIALGGCDADKGGSAGNGAKGGNDPQTAKASPLFTNDFEGVCSGASVSAATAYDPKAAAHKALYFATYEDDLIDRSSALPDDWTINWSPDRDALKGIDLVVCARRTAAREVKICDGYKKDDRPTQNKVRWHTATYELSVREARTGKQLATRTAEATDTDCPMFMNFDGDSETVDDYASLSESAVADFLRPHITH